MHKKRPCGWVQVIALAVLAALLQAQVATGPASSPATRPAAPSEAARASALQTIRKVFRDEYARHGAADRAALARKLLAEAAATHDLPAARYELLEQAAELAGNAGEPSLAAQAIDEQARWFAVATLERKARLLSKTAPAITTPANQELLANLALALMAEAAGEDNFELATQMADLAESAGDRSKKVALVTALQPKLADYRQLAADFALVQRAREKLKTVPDDPQENWTIGRFYCFAKGQWDRGLPYLAKAPDAVMRQLAQRELAGVADPLKQVELADAWWALAEKLTGPARTHTAAHAVAWYQAADKGLTGLTMHKIQQRIAAGDPGKLTDKPTAETRPANETDLLKAIDPTRDAVAGTWQLKEGSLVCAAGSYARLQIRHAVPREYDFVIEFTRTDGDGPVAQMLFARGASFDWAMDVRGEARFEVVGGKIRADNATKVPCELTTNQRHTATVQVRRDGLKAIVDGKPIAAWKTNYTDMSRYSNWRLKDDKLLGIGANRAGVIFHKVVLVEVKDGK